MICWVMTARPNNKGPVLSLSVAEMREPEEVERFRFVFAPLASFFGSKPAELYQAGLIGVQAERKTSQPFPTCYKTAKLRALP